MRRFVGPCVAALATPALAMPTLPLIEPPYTDRVTPAVFIVPEQPASAVTRPTASALEVAAHDAPRSLAFWTTIDLDMLALRDRVEASALLRDGLIESRDLSISLAMN